MLRFFVFGIVGRSKTIKFTVSGARGKRLVMEVTIREVKIEDADGVRGVLNPIIEQGKFTVIDIHSSTSKLLSVSFLSEASSKLLCPRINRC